MKNVEITSPLPAIARFATKLKPYSGVAIFLLFAGVYGYVIFKVNALADPKVDQSTVFTEVKSLPAPKIDETAAQKLLSLKDNSVNVKALFEKGRTNPFDE